MKGLAATAGVFVAFLCTGTNTGCARTTEDVPAGQDAGTDGAADAAALDSYLPPEPCPLLGYTVAPDNPCRYEGSECSYKCGATIRYAGYYFTAKCVDGKWKFTSREECRK